ncbi:hypothetical protein Droror1_Dr00021510 [Drosera rotundifolia]
MLSRLNSSVVWLPPDRDEHDHHEEDDSSPPWNRATANAAAAAENGGEGGGGGVDERADAGVCLPNFKPMLEVDNNAWYLHNNTVPNHSSADIIRAGGGGDNNMINISFSPNLAEADNLLLHSIDSSSSCSASPSVFTNLDPSQVHYLFPPSKPPTLNSLFNYNHHSLDHHGGGGGVGFDLSGQGFFHEASNLVGRGSGAGFSNLTSQNQMGSPGLGINPQFSTAHLVQMPENGNGGGGGDFGSLRFRGFDEDLGNSMFLNNRSKLLKPLDNCASMGSQPTLFQKRAALRKNSGNNLVNSGDSGCDGGGSVSPVLLTGMMLEGNGGGGARFDFGEALEKLRKNGSGDGLDNISIDGSGLNYDSDDFTEMTKFEESTKNEGINSNANSTVTGGGVDSKGKKKGLPAKNLMAERRRRKKLNDRLYMLRSVVPKISKMDRASILGDAIEYLKELLQKINDLHNELESAPPASSLTQTSFYPLTPTLPNLPSRIKEELCPSMLPSPNGQPARIEVRLREGRAVNIHMFCARRPGLLLSVMRSLDSLGLDIQQAVISCFNGFAMDIFQAEQCKDGMDVHPEQIKALLMESAGSQGHGSIILGN